MSKSKKKGDRFERRIARYYRDFLDYKEARRMPLSGAFENLKGDIHKRQDGWLDECKNQEKIALWKSWGQAVSQCGMNQKPVLHITRNRGAELTILYTKDYFNLRKEIKELKDKLCIQVKSSKKKKERKKEK